jgi:hypothetical protein
LFQLFIIVLAVALLLGALALRTDIFQDVTLYEPPVCTAAVATAAPVARAGPPTIPTPGSSGAAIGISSAKSSNTDAAATESPKNKLLYAALAAGGCFGFKSGQKVYATDWGSWTHSVRLHLEGEPVEYWTTHPEDWTPEDSLYAGEMLVVPYSKR